MNTIKKQSLTELILNVENLISTVHSLNEDLKGFLNSEQTQEAAETYRKIEKIKRILTSEVKKITDTVIDI
jgi:hypothetical protein